MDDTPKIAAQTSTGSYRWFALALLVVTYVFSFLDRQVFSILQQAIKVEMHLSDTELGLLGGLAFAVFFTFLGIPVARLADRHSRSRIIAISLALWSIMTALCGAATNFLTLALARVGVGVGEAGCAPPSHSLISDYFPRAERSTAFGIYTLGIPIGAGLGLALGGYINAAFGWREAFVVVGLPGLIMAAVLVFALKEPRRGMSENRVDADATPPPLGEVVKALWQRKTYVYICAAFALTGFVSGTGQWYPPYYIRTFHLDTATIGLYGGISASIFGGLSNFLGGFFADRFAKRDVRWLCWVPASALILHIPLAVLLLFQTSYMRAVPFMFASALFSGAALGPAIGIAQTLAPLRMRAFASSILLFITNIVGLGLGPLFVGIASDVLSQHGINAASGFGASNSLRYALLFNAIPLLGASALYILAARSLSKDLAHANLAND